MNCKQGDLAIIVQSVCGNEGKVVKCLEYAGVFKCTSNGVVGFYDYWKTDTFITFEGGRRDNEIRDCVLRPIRPTDGEDEMLRIAGKPERMTA